VEKRRTFFFIDSHRFLSTGLKFSKLIATCVQHRQITFQTNFENVNNKTPEHRTEEDPKALFWKSA
jgi:hypothetical protein